MQLIVASDIFGRTQALEDLTRNFTKYYKTVQIVDPYEGESIDFEREIDAYKYFQETCGIDVLSEKIKETISGTIPQIDLIGFSVGASAIWDISDSDFYPNIGKAFCFYGSRIRNMTSTNPKFRINLIFPVVEEHFSIDDLIYKTSKKKQVTSIKTEYYHGFMNKKSVNYSHTGYEKYIDYLKHQIA